MYISARERKIIELMLNKSVTVNEIADSIKISSRTVHRVLKSIKLILKRHQINLVKIPDGGMTIQGERDKLEKLKLNLLNGGKEFTAKERQEFILYSLLFGSYSVKLSLLAYDLKVTIGTISNDLDKLEKLLRTFNLLLIRKKGYGIFIKGSESQKRTVIGIFILETLNIYDFLKAIKENTKLNIKNKYSNIHKIINIETAITVGKIIMHMKLPYALADSAYMSLVIHATLVIERGAFKGKAVIFDNNLMEELLLTKEYDISMQITSILNSQFKIQINKHEIAYITMQLQGMKLSQDKQYCSQDSNIEIVYCSKELIKYVSKELNIKFEDDDVLFQGIIAHIQPAIYRIQKNLGVHNPLSSFIENSYPVLFNTIKRGLKIVFPNICFPSEEIAYIVLHFGSSQEIKNDKVKALVVCTSGIGTSRMIVSRLRKEIQEIKNIEVVSMSEFENIGFDEYDIILSTVEMQGFVKKHIVISPLLTKQEINNIRRHIKNNVNIKEERLLKVSKKSKDVVKKDTITNKYRKIQAFSQCAEQILSAYTAVTISPIETIYDLLSQISFKLYNLRLVSDYKKAANDLLQRLNSRGVGIPGTNMALFHCRTEFIDKPVFASFKLTGSIQVKSMDDSLIQLKTALVLLAPFNLSDEQIEVLSAISYAIIENEQSIKIFCSNDFEDIFKKLDSTFNLMLKNKLE